MKMLELQATRSPSRPQVLFLQSSAKGRIVENDFEAFVNTLDLYDFVGQATLPASDSPSTLPWYLDRPEMLDELIRRSGVGIPIPSDPAKGQWGGL
jgi:hypothetical protein